MTGSAKSVMSHGSGQVHSTCANLMPGRGSGAWFKYLASRRQVIFFTAIPTSFPQSQG